MTLLTEKFQEQDQDSWQEARKCEGLTHLELWRKLNISGNHFNFNFSSNENFLSINQAEGSNSDTYLHPVKV